MYAMPQINPTMSDGRWLSITLSAGVGGNLSSPGSTAGVTLGERFVGHDHLVINARYVA